MAVIAQTLVDAPTTTGTQDITISGFGAVAGFILLACQVCTSTDTITASGSLAYGVSDASNIFTTTVAAMDGVTTTNCTRQNDEATGTFTVMAPHPTSAIEDVASLDSLVTDGIRLNWTVKSSQAYKILAVFFDSTFSVGMENHDASAESDVVTSIGFLSKVVLGIGAGSVFTGGTGTVSFSAGVTNGINEYSLGVLSSDASTPSSCSAYFSTSDTVVTLNSDGAILRSANIDTFTPLGFTITNPGAGFDITAAGLAGHKFAIGQFATPTVVGVKTYTLSGGFTPEYLLIGASAAVSVNTGYGSGDPAFSISMSSVTATEAYAFCMADRDAVATAESNSLVSTKALALLDSTSPATIVEADLDSFAKNEFALDFTKVDTSARQFWVLAIGEQVIDLGGDDLLLLGVGE